MTLEEYIKGIPVELRNAISGFDNDIRLGIFLALEKHGELAFSDLGEKLGMKTDKAKLYFHLGKLTESALVEHRYRHQLGNEKFSFYAVTKYGKGLWNNIVSSFKPPLPIVRMEDSTEKYRIEEIIEEPDLGNFVFSDNPSIAIVARTKKERRQKMPKKFSDEVNYEKAVVEAET